MSEHAIVLTAMWIAIGIIGFRDGLAALLMAFFATIVTIAVLGVK
jgi:hypothetical protein